MERRSFRDLLAFWLFGMCSNFGYVLMLTGAKDMLTKSTVSTTTITAISTQKCLNSTSDFHCEPISTGAVLLCNIVPATVVQLIFPIFIHRIPYFIRILAICITQLFSLIVASAASSITVTLFAVSVGSISFGIGEMTFLALSSKYHKDTISLYSSGCGAAGIIGSSIYALATTNLNISPDSVLLSMTIIPVVLLVDYFFILTKVPPIGVSQKVLAHMEHPQNEAMSIEKAIIKSSVDQLPQGKLQTIIKVIPYAITVGLTYFLCYFITQGMTTFLVFTCALGFGLSPNAQFRWYQVLYNLGAFTAKSTGPLLPIHRFVLFSIPLAQLFVCVLLVLSALLVISLPHVSMVMFSICFLGLTNGFAYINSFKQVHKKTHPEDREFALTITSPASFVGILIAGLAALPTHQNKSSVKATTSPATLNFQTSMSEVMNPLASSFLASIQKMLELNHMINPSANSREIALAMSALGSIQMQNVPREKELKKVNLERKIENLMRTKNLEKEDENKFGGDEAVPSNTSNEISPSVSQIKTVDEVEPRRGVEPISKPFMCDECGARFTRKAGMRRHKSSVHSADRIPCPSENCTLGFRSHKSLEQHVRSTHLTPKTSTDERKKRNRSNRPKS
ncbi:unnamed protein product, partial [Mesorhabditis belari]|uniref:C2H2-type domain-containing protein n=1 Tax=Mesorhabditis belari TaxID=2138241 RepID=A0AAF3F6S1_9BILA